MEFISQKEFDAFINSLGNGTESAEINDFQNFFAHNDFSSSVLQQNQLPGSFADQKRDTISNHAYPQIAAIPTIPGHSVLASSLDFEMMQSQTAPVLTQVDSQNFIPAYPTTLGAFPTELFGNSDVSSPDQSLSDGQYAYSSSGPSSPDSTSVLSAAPSSPDVQYLSQKQNPAFTPMFGVPANYGIDDQRGYEISSPQMKHKPVVVKQERTDLMEELEARVGWSSSDGKDEKSRKKPRDASKESQQEKHKSAEKQRRSNMNELLDRLKQLLPNSHTAEVQKMTKLTILGETVDYVVKLQELCKDLIQENKQLKAQMEKNPLSVASSPGPVAIGRKVAPSNPPQAAAEDAGSKKRKLGLVAGVQQYVMDGSRAIFLSVFFLMVVFSPYADHSHLGMPDSFDATAQTRGVLGNDAHTVVPPAVASGFVAFSSLSLLSSFLFNFIKWGILVIAGFAFMVWGDRSISTKSPNFAKAKEEFEIAQFQVLSGQWGEVEEHCRSALELLDRDPPRSYFMALLLTTYQLWRHIMHRFVIGVYIERFVASVKGTEKEYSELVCDVSSILLKAWHRAPPNVEWLYICLDALNTARVMAPNKVLGLTASSTFRIRGNTGMAFRMWEIYIDWGLRSMKETLVDTSLEQKHLLYSAEGIKFVVQGELVQAKASLKKALDIAALFENERMGFFVYLKTLSMIACVLIFERRWAEALQLYKMLITAAEAKQHKSGVFWGVVGLCACLVKLKEFSKAKYVRKYYMANFPTYLGCSSVGSIDVTNIEILVGEGKYLKAVEQAEILLKKLSRHDMMVHSLPGYLAFGEVVLDLWEESLSETSSLRAHSSKLARMSHEVCTFVYKIATANPVIQPRALIFKGRYYFILKNYPKAKYYWTSSLDTARKLGLKADEKAVAEMLSTHTQLEINDDCHKNCPQMAIEKLVSTLTQQ